MAQSQLRNLKLRAESPKGISFLTQVIKSQEQKSPFPSPSKNGRDPQQICISTAASYVYLSNKELDPEFNPESVPKNRLKQSANWNFGKVAMKRLICLCFSEDQLLYLRALCYYFLFLILFLIFCIIANNKKNEEKEMINVSSFEKVGLGEIIFLSSKTH